MGKAVGINAVGINLGAPNSVIAAVAGGQPDNPDNVAAAGLDTDGDG